MASVSYPSTLPQNMLVNGYGHTAADNVLRSKMDAGPDKTRRRFTSGPEPVRGQIFVTDAQLQIFRDWHKNDLLDGAIRFDWVDQDDGTTAVEYKFVSPPSWHQDEKLPGYWFINLDLRIMP